MNAMDKALKQIEMTFSSERQAVNERVMNLCRCAEMLDTTWEDTAFHMVLEYNIFNRTELQLAVEETIASETELLDHEFIRGADTNVLQLKKVLENL